MSPQVGRQGGRRETGRCGSIEGKRRKSCKKSEVINSIKGHTELFSNIRSEQYPLYEDRVVITDLIRACSEERLGEMRVWNQDIQPGIGGGEIGN